MITYAVDIKNLKELQERFKQAPDITTKRIIEAGNTSLIALQGTAKQLAPVDTTHLRGSILVDPMKRNGTTISGSVGTNTKYSVIQEIGSGIYGPMQRPITPKNGKYLTFKTKDGHWIRVKSVKGVKGKFYMKGSVEQNQPKVDLYFADAAANIAKDLAA